MVVTPLTRILNERRKAPAPCTAVDTGRRSATVIVVHPQFALSFWRTSRYRCLHGVLDRVISPPDAEEMGEEAVRRLITAQDAC